MATVFIHIVMSLDGFIAKPDEMDTEWMFRYGDSENDSDEMATRIMGALGAVVLGNKDFRLGTVTADRLPYGGLPVPQFVVTHHERAPLSIGPLTFTFVSEGIEQAIRLAKEAAGDRRVALLGASISQQCLKAGLVDEIVIHLVPLLLGDGLSLFGRLGAEYELVREEVILSGQVTSLRFRVVR